MTQILDCNGKLLCLNRTQVMGILNLTPDSFFDGGRYTLQQAALLRARQMVDEGATIIDIGGESTRPGASPVSLEEEMERVIPLIELLAAELPVPLSIDTSKPGIMHAAVAAGAGMINDVRALRMPGALAAAAEINSRASVPICLMHMQGEPSSMQSEPHYHDVVAEVENFLQSRLAACMDAGIPRARLIIDPGFGFGKTLAHNLLLLRQLHELARLNAPILAGLSRKSLISAVLKIPADERLHGSLALAVLAAWQGASIIRTHDVRATAEAVSLCNAVKAVKRPLIN